MCVDFLDVGSACEVQWTHMGIPDEESAAHHAAGNAHTLEALAELLTT